MMDRQPITLQGAEALRAELKQLKTVERPAVIQAIAEAREHGDLKENAEYHAAREQQGFLEGRIKEIESVLSHAQIIDVKTLNPNGKVVFGATVTLLNLDSEEDVCYQIVGAQESDIANNKISVTSPIARALIGKTVGDEVQVKAPSGIIEYEIIDVHYV
jgi:transcription elongation factor GreA